MSEIKSWRQVAVPREDVRSGRIRRDEFAANLPLVISGNAAKEYQDPVAFYSQTYITEGIQGLLRAVLKRLTGNGGEPVIQLQTAFGGGKTHSLLCVYHLVKSGPQLQENPELKKIFTELNIHDAPQGNVVVLDGTDFAPNQPKDHGNIKTHTLLGELAWQLGGEVAYERVRAADETGTTIGQSEIGELLTEYGPCVILLDEIVVYLRQLGEVQGQMTGGTIAQNLSFIQNLTAAAQGVSNCVILASLPASDGGVQAGGDTGARVLRSVEAIFGRVQTLWKPVAPEEGYSIVRRRLFENIEDTEARELACNELFNRYSEDGIADNVPKEVREQVYLDKMLQTYPFHPELFDRLYEDWTTLEGFQRTRGVLQLLSEVVYELWKSDHQDAFIMPGDLPLDAAEVKNLLTGYLPPGWDAVVDSEVDGDTAEAVRIDNKEPARFGTVRACRRVSRAVFLGSAPMGRAENTGNHGLLRSHVLLGTLRTTDNPGAYRDAVETMSASLKYFSSSIDRLWYGVRPNLNQEAQGRARQVSDDQIVECVKGYLRQAIRETHLRVHVFVESEDIPDDDELRLIVLPMQSDATRNVGGEHEGGARIYAKDILGYRGTVPRLNQNRVIFLAFDASSVAQVERTVQQHLAWKSILDDAEQKRIELLVSDVSMAKEHVERSRRVYENAVANACIWLMVPKQTVDGDAVSEIDFYIDKVQFNSIWRTLVSSEYVIERWAPQFLKDQLIKWFFERGSTEVNSTLLWEKLSQYCYLPRLLNRTVLDATIRKGTEDSLLFTKLSDQNTLIAQPEVVEGAPIPTTTSTDTPGNLFTSDVKTKTPDTLHGTRGSETKKFFGTFVLPAEQASKTKYAEIYNEVIDHLQKGGGQVRIELSISATHPNGYSVEDQRTIRENANTLGANRETLGFSE